MVKKKPIHYVDNEKFLAAIIVFRDKVAAAKEEGKERPRVGNYIGECFMKIAVHLARNRNFTLYPYKEDMISDGIENCLQYIDNFDPNKFTDRKPNPFAYFTQIIYFAFLRRIEKEKKQLYTKYKVTEHAQSYSLNQTSHSHDGSSDHGTSARAGEWSQDYMHRFIGDFEESRRKKKEKTKKSKT